jgi:hypothetical protein
MFSETRHLQACAAKTAVELIPTLSGDYTSGTALYKYQWDLIHDPQRVWFSWMEEEGEGASYMTLITKEGKGIGSDLPDYEKKYCFFTPSLVPIWIKDAEEITFFDNGTVSSFVIEGVKYAAIINDISTYFYYYYDYNDFIQLKNDKTRQTIDGIIIEQDLNKSKIYSNYLLAKHNDPVFLFTDYSRLGINCIKLEYYNVSTSIEPSKISGQFKDPVIPETVKTIAKVGECESLDIVNQYNIGDGIGRDFFILFYQGCNENQTKIDELVSFCKKLNQDESNNCKGAKHKITDAFAKKLQDDGIITLESFLDKYNIGYSLGTMVISDIDLWIYLTDDYNSVSKWEYSVAELKLRYKLLQNNDPIARWILINEREGKAQPLTGEAFKRKYGDASSLVAFILFFQLEADLLDISAGVEVAKRAASLFKSTKTRPFSTASITNKKVLRNIKLRQLEEGCEAILKNLDTQIKQLDGIKPSDNTLTSLSKKLIDENAIKIVPSEGQIKNIVDDIIKNGDIDGNKTEGLSDLLYVRNGFNKVDNIKLNGDQGFDGVYIKGTIDNPTEIIINEAKQMNNGAVKLNPANFETGLPAQMSDG